ncbi:MAG: alanine racemase, partial [Odoribacter sp.]|nr:alanine racemase [Odoribacter sp.]
MDFTKIIKPSLILDESRCRKNIASMAEKARLSGVVFRPHFKTHQSSEIGEWFIHEGVDSITVSSVTMAKYFAGKGWSNITIAFPLNLREVEDAEMLSHTVSLNILISDYHQAGFLRKSKSLKAGYFIKIN